MQPERPRFRHAPIPRQHVGNRAQHKAFALELLRNGAQQTIIAKGFNSDPGNKGRAPYVRRDRKERGAFYFSGENNVLNPGVPKRFEDCPRRPHSVPGVRHPVRNFRIGLAVECQNEEALPARPAGGDNLARQTTAPGDDPKGSVHGVGHVTQRGWQMARLLSVRMNSTISIIARLSFINPLTSSIRSAIVPSAANSRR